MKFFLRNKFDIEKLNGTWIKLTGQINFPNKLTFDVLSDKDSIKIIEENSHLCIFNIKSKNEECQINYQRFQFKIDTETNNETNNPLPYNIKVIIIKI